MNPNKNEQFIIELETKGLNLTKREIHTENGKIYILGIKEIIDLNALAEHVVKPLVTFCNSNNQISSKQIMNNIIYTFDSQLDTDLNLIEAKLLDGMVIIILSNDIEFIISNIKKVEKRSIPTPEIDYTIRGPKDCLVENIEVNISLMRYRIKDPNLMIEYFTIGKRTSTSVAILYLKDVANDEIVNKIKDRLNKINIDSIWGTGELQTFLQNSKHALFSILRTVERSDMACELILEGRVLILADGGPLGIVAPHNFSESLNACDDRYDNKYFGLFSRIIRYLALFVTLCFSSLYIAIVSYHTDVLPAPFAISLAQMRQNVLFSAFVEVLIIEFIIELIRESLIRVPTKIGAAIAIVGAIVIGQAATAAGLFSPLVLIIAAATLMASFSIPNYYAVHPIRILKLLVIVMTGFLGLYGFVLAMTLILINLVSIDSFGVPYIAPFAPFNKYDFIRQFIFNRSTSKKRQKMVGTKDDTRSNTVSE